MNDRRVRRTHQLLHNALMELIAEKGYDAITIQDITDRADLARSTFYLHFRDKDELLFNSMRGIYEALLTAVEPGTMDSPVDYEHIAEYADFYRIMLGEHGSPAFISRLWAFLVELMQRQVVPDDSPFPRDLIAYFLAGAQMGVYRWWLQNDLQPPPDDIARMAQNLAVFGLFNGGQEDET